MLGGGKFGEVRVCTVKETGLKLAVKTIKTQGPKDREMVELEIDVMNQLNHRNLIQLYDAIETPKTIMLFMEFVEGGELFERIIDEDYPLTEVDCMVFVRQICDGILFMHQMRVLHLDLKPENILCVSATGHMVKIIDFGLARRYNPREKLKVNFGTPEFLSPEVVSYEQVSYTTDMWSMGVITYMLLSGLSPFLGDNDTETLNNVLAANWYFDEEAFEGISEEAKDFVSNLIIKDKRGRMNAGQCLQHPWLNNLAEKAGRVNRRLKSQVLLRKYVMRRRWKMRLQQRLPKPGSPPLPSAQLLQEIRERRQVRKQHVLPYHKEVLDGQGEQKPEELAVSSHEGGGRGEEPATGESKDVEAPALPQEPAGEPPSLAEKEAERTLAEPPSTAPERASAETAANVPTEEPHPSEQLPSENKADVATPAEVEAPPVPESPTGPFLTPDFGKEDPATIL
ncbi:hypothetical protein JD844_019302, partial [Phrynosoma platyrhinos]